MEKQFLKLDHIKLTPEIIDTINLIQTGGTIDFDVPPEQINFNNCAAGDYLKELTDLNDFILSSHAASNYYEDATYLKHLGSIMKLKGLIRSLMAPIN